MTRERREQDRHRALEPAPHHEQPLAPVAAGRAAGARRRRAAGSTKASSDREHEPVEPDVARRRRRVRSIVRPSATKTAISARLASEEWKPSISPLRGSARVADQHPGDEDGEEARAVHERRGAVDHAGGGEHAERVERRLAAARRAASAAAARGAPATPTASAAGHLDRELLTTVQNEPSSVVASSIIPIISAIPTGSFAPDSPCEDRAGAAADLAAAEHGEHDRRVGGRERGAEQAARDPARGRAGSARRRRSARRSRTCRARRARGSARPRTAEAPPADVHAAVEEDHDQRDDARSARRSRTRSRRRARARGPRRPRPRRGRAPALGIAIRSVSVRPKSASEKPPATTSTISPKVAISSTRRL